MRLFKKESPNQGSRPHGTIIDCIVLHADASPTVAQSLSWIMSAQSKVSYHALIGRMGDVYQCVDPSRRSWHAGASEYQGRHDCNNYSVGVSFGNRNDGREPYRPDQIEAGVALCVDLIRKWPAITPERITTHQVVATCDKKVAACRGKHTCEHYPTGRKHDPGKLFPLDDFRAEIADRLDRG